MAVVLVVTKVFYLRHGDTPTEATFAGDGLKAVSFTPSLVKDLIYPLAGPTLAWLPLEPVLRFMVSSGETLALLLAVGLSFATLKLAWAAGSPRFALLVSVALAGYTSFFALQYVQDAAISWEARHFLPVASLMALIWARFLAERVGTIRWGILGLLSTAWGYQHAVIGLHRYPIWKENTVIHAGETLPRALLPVWEKVRRLDDEAEPPNTLFLILPWNRSLELAVKRSRLIPLSPGNTGMPSFRSHGVFFPGSSYQGAGPEVFLVLDDTIDPAVIQRSFKAYARRERIFSTGAWSIYRLTVQAD